MQNVKEQVIDLGLVQVRDLVDEQIGLQVFRHIWDQLWAQVKRQFWEQVRNQVSEYIF